MSGLTPTGFDRKRLIDIKTEIEDALKILFGDNIDLTPQSGFGQLIGIFSESISDQWESQENIYNSQYPSTSQENQLSNVVMYNGIERQEATNSTVTGTITGTNGTVIPAGSKASVEGTGSVFVTLVEGTISGGTVDVSMQSEVAGSIEAVTGTLNTIDTPIFGWETITNSSDALVGNDEETDAELRERREQSTQALGQNLVDSLVGQLLDLDGVTDAVVVSNGTESTVDGIPPHQFESSVLGGIIADIAEAVWVNTPQGIKSYGSTTTSHTDVQGFPQEIKFTIPSEVNIYFRVIITTNSLEFPALGEDDIKQAIVDYGVANFKIFDDVILSEFYTPINTIPGILTIDLRMGLGASPTETDNIEISLQEISSYALTQIEVAIV